MKIAEHGPDLASQELVDSVPALIHTARPDEYIGSLGQSAVSILSSSTE